MIKSVDIYNVYIYNCCLMKFNILLSSIPYYHDIVKNKIEYPMI